MRDQHVPFSFQLFRKKLLDQQFHGTVNLVIAPLKSLDNKPFLVDDKECRQGSNGKIVKDRFTGKRRRISDSLFGKGFQNLIPPFISAQPQHLQPLFVILPVEVVQMLNRLTARRAPGGKEVYDKNITFIVSQGNLLPGSGSHSEGRGGFSLSNQGKARQRLTQNRNCCRSEEKPG